LTRIWLRRFIHALEVGWEGYGVGPLLGILDLLLRGWTQDHRGGCFGAREAEDAKEGVGETGSP